MCNLISLYVNILLLADMHGQSPSVLHVEPKWDGFLQPPTKNLGLIHFGVFGAVKLQKKYAETFSFTDVINRGRIVTSFI